MAAGVLTAEILMLLDHCDLRPAGNPSFGGQNIRSINRVRASYGTPRSDDLDGYRKHKWPSSESDDAAEGHCLCVATLCGYRVIAISIISLPASLAFSLPFRSIVRATFWIFWLVAPLFKGVGSLKTWMILRSGSSRFSICSSVQRMCSGSKKSKGP